MARVIFLGALLAPALAAADPVVEEGGGAVLRLFRPAVDSKGLFSIDGTSILGHGDLSFGLVADAGLGLLDVEGDPAVPTALTGTLHANVGLWNFLAVGVELPLGILEVERIGDPQSGRDGRVPGLRSTPACAVSPTDAECRTVASVQDLTELVVHGKLRLLRSERTPFGLAIVVRAGLPVGDARALVTDPGGTLWPELAIDSTPTRRLRLAANVGYRMVLGEGSTIGAQGDAFTYGDHLTAGLGASYAIVPEALDVAVESYAHQLVTGGPPAAEAIAGLRVYVERRSYLSLAAGRGVLDGFDSADTRLVLGFVFEPSIGDMDGDGIKDDVDRCVADPEDWDLFEDEDGCPEPDDDRDGILDVDDDCARIPEDRDGTEDDDGCPEGLEGDRDGDGIMDAVDECPDEPEDRDSFEDEEGCPENDNDQDGRLDPDDLCPNDPEDVDRFEDLDGCPDPDNDEDRILDVDDTCPDNPEEYNGLEDEDGCPDVGIARLGDGEVFAMRRIEFETDSAVIRAESTDILDAVAATIVGNPQVTLVEVQGHADERAPDDYNLTLTRERAAAVLAALVQRGVPRGHLRSVGYGERCPRDPRHTAGAWDRNRRVEFKVIATDAGPTNVEIACPAGRSLIPR